MTDIVLFRIAERLTLTGVVLIIALVVMIGFWRTVQELNVAEGGKLGVAGSFVFSTPVFVLLAVIGYAYVSLSHPITVSPDTSVEVASTGGQGSGFIGSVGLADPDDGSVTDFERSSALGKVKSINCLLQGDPMSARVEDDLADVKLALLGPVWAERWGPIEPFSEWAMGLSTVAPNVEALAVYSERHPIC